MVLVTAVASSSTRPGIDFLPVTVDYLEKTSAAGKTPGGYFKREGRMIEVEVLTSRLIDRPSRPLFRKGWRFDFQVIAMAVSTDRENASDVLAMTGASCALHISDIPGAARTSVSERDESKDSCWSIPPSLSGSSRTSIS